MTATVTEATRAPYEHVVHGIRRGRPVAKRVTATTQAEAIRASRLPRRGVRVHAAWFDCPKCRAVTS